MAEWCAAHDVPFVKYGGVDDIVRTASDTGAGAALIAGWYHMVPGRVRALFPLGCVGLHASLLPRYRGGAPLTWAILNGEPEAGASLFELGDGIDDGPVYAQRRFPIGPSDYIADVLARAEAASLDLVTEVLPPLLRGNLKPVAQEGEPSYGLQRRPSDGDIDWRRSAQEIARLVRGVSRPYPGARTTFNGQLLTIWRARTDAYAPRVNGTPGQIACLNETPTPGVVTGDGVLWLEEVEGPSGFSVRDLLQLHHRRLGTAG
jgi:methionyl-tRNA formyltransferase